MKYVVKVLLVYFMLGCGLPNTATPNRIPAPSRIEVAVVNGSTELMRVYAVNGSIEYRIGEVSPLQTEIFKISRHLFSPTRPMDILLKPLAGFRNVFVEGVYVSPESRQVVIEIHSLLSTSSVSVYHFYRIMK